MKISRLPVTAKIKIAKYSRNTLNLETAKIFNRENFPSYGTFTSAIKVHVTLWSKAAFTLGRF